MLQGSVTKRQNFPLTNILVVVCSISMRILWCCVQHGMLFCCGIDLHVFMCLELSMLFVVERLWMFCCLWEPACVCAGISTATRSRRCLLMCSRDCPQFLPCKKSLIFVCACVLICQCVSLMCRVMLRLMIVDDAVAHSFSKALGHTE